MKSSKQTCLNGANCTTLLESSHVFQNSLCFCKYSREQYISVQLDLHRESLIELTAKALVVTQSRCGLDRQVSEAGDLESIRGAGKGGV